jgi:hypothetical protein
LSATTSSPASIKARDLEFDRQLLVMLDKSFPALAGISEAEFRGHVEPLRDRLTDLPAPSGDTALPFAIVISRDLVPTEAAMSHVIDSRGKSGVVNMDPVSPDDFKPVDGLGVPPGHAYMLADIDLGAKFLDVRPKDALPSIEKSGRLTLTIDEGIAIMTQYGDVLQTHNAFQLLASRQDSQRIPSIWRSYNRPRLGWCWDGAPHPWMGSASAAIRLT